MNNEKFGRSLSATHLPVPNRSIKRLPQAFLFTTPPPRFYIFCDPIFFFNLFDSGRPRPHNELHAEMVNRHFSTEDPKKKKNKYKK